jgi:hypothetical protein
MRSPRSAIIPDAPARIGFGVVQKMFSTRIQRVGAFPSAQIAKPSRRLSLRSKRPGPKSSGLVIHQKDSRGRFCQFASFRSLGRRKSESGLKSVTT